MKNRLSACRRYCLIVLCAALLISATGCSIFAEKKSNAFDGEKAYKLLVDQVEIGPRYPGIAGHDKCLDMIVSKLKPFADDVNVQEFSQTIAGKKLTLHNIIAKFNPAAKRSVLLAAHWDTRPIADMEIDSAKREQPILGANDGASGVAVLLELARIFHENRPDVGVVMVFFDGEDYATKSHSSDAMFLGSKYFAKHLESATKDTIAYGILLDMIGDKNLTIYTESVSVNAAPDVVKCVWDSAKSLGYEKCFVNEAKYSISDDHVPLINAGIKCIDVIDFDYGPWHTLDDTADKCSAESLKIVGDVIAKVIYEEKPS